MKRIDDNSVMLTRTESAASDEFHAYLDAGYDMEQALIMVKGDHRLSQEFYDWLVLLNTDSAKARFWRITGSCPSYCHCRRLDSRGETPRRPGLCPYEAAYLADK